MATPKPSKYKLSRASKQRLERVHPVLSRIVQRAIQLTETDFAVVEGARLPERQRQLYEAGKTQTLKSRHIPAIPAACPELGPVSHAVDLAGWVNQLSSWDVAHLCDIADAMRKAADEEGVAIKWGGCWDVLHNYPSAADACLSYLQRKMNAGEKPFIDGAHFQLTWAEFPV